MALCFRKFISEVFVNGKFPKILPSENFPLYGTTQLGSYHAAILYQLLVIIAICISHGKQIAIATYTIMH